MLTAGSGAGLEKYRQWQQRRLIASAQSFLKNGDARSAWLTAQQAFNRDPHSAEACKILVTVADNEHSPAALLWMQKLIELEPRENLHFIRLAIIACRFNEPSVAEQALTQVTGADRDTSAFHQAAAALALAKRDLPSAEEHFQKAVALESKNKSLQISLATLHLVGGNATAASEARGVLEKFSADSEVRAAALRALLADASAQKDGARAMQFATELHAAPGATIDDQLLYLGELQRAKSSALNGALSELQKNCASKAGTAASLMVWMNAHGLARDSAAWGGALPVALRTQMPVPIALAESLTALAEWENLRKLVNKADWGALDFLRLAIHARASVEISGNIRGSDFDLKWNRALIATHGNPNAAVMLARLVENWGWKKEAAQAWWIAAGQTTGQRPALEALFRIYSDEKNAPDLYRVARKLYELEPASPVAKNNLASLALLLGRDLPEAHRLASENSRQNPAEPVIASTYAFSLLLQNRASEGIKVMEKFPASALSEPSIAAYYGVVLVASGEAEKAKPYLDIAMENKAQLFKEEIVLVQKAAGK